MRENIRINLNNEIFYVTTEDTMLELENKLNRLETALNIIIITVIVESIFIIPMYIALVAKGF